MVGRNSSHHTHHGLDFALAIVYILVFIAWITTTPTVHQWVVGVFTILTENANGESLVFRLSEFVAVAVVTTFSAGIGFSAGSLYWLIHWLILLFKERKDV